MLFYFSAVDLRAHSLGLIASYRAEALLSPPPRSPSGLRSHAAYFSAELPDIQSASHTLKYWVLIFFILSQHCLIVLWYPRSIKKKLADFSKYLLFILCAVVCTHFRQTLREQKHQCCSVHILCNRAVPKPTSSSGAKAEKAEWSHKSNKLDLGCQTCLGMIRIS